MRKPIFIELYSGSGTMSEVARANGFLTFEVDIRKRTGTCVPDFRIDILKMCPEQLYLALCAKYNIIDISAQDIIIHGSIPCPRFSYAAGDNYYYKGRLRKEYAIESTKHLRKTQEIIEYFKPLFYFIENPRGHLRHEPILIDWLTRNDGMTKELTYSSYGTSFPKPTNFFTNLKLWRPKEMDKWGRGAKYQGDMNNLTTHQRQLVPKALAQEICECINLHRLISTQTVELLVNPSLWEKNGLIRSDITNYLDTVETPVPPITAYSSTCKPIYKSI
jgi:hypothetical protein